MAPIWIKILFTVAGFYDLLLGLVFLMLGTKIYAMEGLAPPNHLGYFQFPALLLMLFGLMFYRIAAAPAERRELMIYGMGLKLAFCAVVLGHAAIHDMPPLWMPFAWADLVFLVLFGIAWSKTKPGVDAST